MARVKEPRGNARRVTAAAPFKGASFPPSVDLLEQRSAEGPQVGVARLDERLAERTAVC
jgi:hypothetical protein